MGKRQQFLLALVCLLASYLAGNGLFLLVNNMSNGTQEGSEYPVQRVNALSSAAAGGLGPVADFALQDEFNNERSFEEAHRGRPAFVYFFSGDCKHCSNMLRSMNRVLPRVRERGFRIIGIQHEGTPDQGQYIRRQYDLPPPILEDINGEVCGRFGVGEFTVFLVGTDNNLYFRSLMNGSNWPDDEALEATLAAGGRPKNVEVTKGEDLLMQPDAIPAGRLKGTILSSHPELLRLYQPTFIGLITLILLATVLGLFMTKGSWLPLLAAAELLLMGVVWDVWLYWPANLFLVLTALLLLTKQKRMLCAAAGFGMLSIVSLLRPISNELSGARLEQLQQMAVIWRFMPQLLLSLLLFRLAFRAQKEKYQKVALAGPGGLAPTPAHDGMMAIHGVSRPERCDVCHQTDQFDPETGYCLRCKVKTI